jgi:hypothetical protein
VNSYIEYFQSNIRGEMHLEEFSSLTEEEVLNEAWKRRYNKFGSHSFVVYSVTTPEAIVVAILT